MHLSFAVRFLSFPILASTFLPAIFRNVAKTATLVAGHVLVSSFSFALSQSINIHRIIRGHPSRRLDVQASNFCSHSVVVSKTDPDRSWFGANVPGSLVNDWFSAMKHIIGTVETYALVVARSVWHQHLVGKRCMYFCDNYGAMDAFIKGSSSNSDIRKLLLCFEQLECNGSHWSWFSRVPRRATVLMIQLGLDMCWAVSYMEQSVIVACAPLQVWSF